MNDLLLTGRKQIQDFVGRPWRIITSWVEKEGFPAAKIDGRWESDGELIRAWRRSKIEKVCQGDKMTIKRG